MAKQRNPNGMGNYRKLKDGRVAWRQTVDGEVREVSAKDMKTLQEKVKKIADLPIIKEKYKVEEWFEKWLEVYIKPLKKKATHDFYKTMYNSHIKPVIGNRKMISIKPYDLQSIIAKMNDKIVKEAVIDKTGKITEPEKRGLSSQTMKHVRTTMSVAFGKAFKEKIIPINPVVNIEIPVKQKRPQKTLTPQELSKIFKSMNNSRWIWSVKFLLVTGIRRGEILALKWTDIDFINKRMVIDKSYTRNGLGDTKKSKMHYVPLSDKAIEYLDCQRRQLEKEFNPSLYNEELKKLCLVFPSIKGTYVEPTTYYSTIKRLSEKEGVKVSPHCFRHTFVYMTKNKLTLQEIQDILGHDEKTTTLDIYGNMLNESTSKTASQIDSIFNELDVQINKASEEKKLAKVIKFNTFKK